MIIKYKFLSTNAVDNSVVVRFYSDTVSEADLATQWHPDGAIQACRSDYSVMLPEVTPVGAALDAFILAHAPTAWLASVARHKAGQGNAVLTGIDSLVGTEFLQGAVTVPVADALAAAKTVMNSRIDAYRTNILAAGVFYNGVTFDSDAVSVGNVTAMAAYVNGGGVVPAEFTWRAKDNTNIVFSSDDVKNLLGTMIARANEVYVLSWVKKTEVAACTSEAQANAVTWKISGYPLGAIEPAAGTIPVAVL